MDVNGKETILLLFKFAHFVKGRRLDRQYFNPPDVP